MIFSIRPETESLIYMYLWRGLLGGPRD